MVDQLWMWIVSITVKLRQSSDGVGIKSFKRAKQ
jgi:hypothetical protein